MIVDFPVCLINDLRYDMDIDTPWIHIVSIIFNQST
jgi:hypothetical protein